MKKNRLVFAATALTWFFQAHAQEIDLQAVVRDTQIMRQSGSNMDMVWWLPTEFWSASFSKSPGVSAKQVNELVATVDDYIVLAVLESAIGTLGVLSSTSKEELEKKITLTVGDLELRPTPESELTPGAGNLLKLMKPVTANMMGQLGQGMHFIAFKGADSDGKTLVDAKRPGRFSVKLGAKEFVFRLPLGSVLPPKIDRQTGEQFPGNYEFNPFTGKKLIVAQ